MTKNFINKKQTFYEICEENKSNFYILDYYPFGSKTEWEYWLCGKVNLKKEYLNKSYEKLTETDLILKILKEVGRAMHYTVVPYGSDQEKDDWFMRQRIEAFNMWKLFTCGEISWNKKILKNKTVKEVEALEKLNLKKYYKAIGKIDNNLKIFKDKQSKDKYLKLVEKNKLTYFKKYGILEVKHMPLMQRCTNKPLYTKQQLCAIWLIVECAFENMC